ncbi:MAG TPA: acyltransferase [Actinopolymorphaceae bacterium]|jgi:acetyltransferase-like isoleucine patch superfamily enzyme
MSDPRENPLNRIADNVVLGKRVSVVAFVNLYGCTIGDDTKIGPFVEIQSGVTVGARCKISSHSFLCEGVTIEDEVFIGHHVCFTNDVLPRATTDDGRLKTAADWELVPTVVRRRASIGSGAVILPGVEIGEEAVIGAGAVVTRDVAPRQVVAGVPARLLRTLDPAVSPSED